MATERARRRCGERLERLCGSGLDSESIQREAIVELRRVVGFERWCWPSADPGTLVPLGGIADHDYGPRVPRALELEYSGADYAAKDVLARRSTSVGSLGAETDGDLARSPRWDEVMRPVGIGDVATVACRDRLGCWGWLEAYRDSDDRRFEAADLELLARLGPSFGSVLRRSVGRVRRGDGGKPDAGGVILLDGDLGVVAWTEAARAWIDALPAARLFAAWGTLHAVVYPVATRARARAASAHALLQADAGGWVAIDAAPLEGGGRAEIAVGVRGATARETFDLLCRAWALTVRERQVVVLVASGLDTRAVTGQLSISRHTVQDHLKSVFAKAGVRSRRELLARLSPQDPN